MCSLFKRKEETLKGTRLFYFSGQRPKERIDNFVLAFLKPVFDKNQFQFKRSNFTFHKKKGDFLQVIHFKRSVHNTIDRSVRFDIMFSIFDETYNRWHKIFYGTKAPTNQLFGCSGVHIKNWGKEFMDNAWYDLALYDNDKIIQSILSNVNFVAVPELDRLSNRSYAVNTLRRTSFNVCPLLFDYCIIENDKIAAEKILEDFKSYLNSKNTIPNAEKQSLYEIRQRTFQNWA